MQSKSTNLESKISAPKNTKEKLQKEYHAVLASQYKQTAMQDPTGSHTRLNFARNLFPLELSFL